MWFFKKKEPRQSKWNGQNVSDLFNSYAKSCGAVYRTPGLENTIQGCGLFIDKNDDPYINFIFLKGTQPDLSKMPKTLTSDDGTGTLPVKYEFRGPARLA